MRVLFLVCCFVGTLLAYTDTQASVHFIVNKSEITQTGSSNLEKPISGTSCPTGYEKVGGICMDVNACETAFPLTSASNKVGSYVTKNCGSKGVHYCYTSCQTGWKKSDCECKAVDCNAFPFSESDGHHCNGIKSCKTGNSYKYKCTACADGYNLSDGSCIDKACSDYGTGYYSSVTANCTNVEIGKTGSTYCYKCTQCKEGWTLNANNNKCEENTCDYTTSRISNCIRYESITKTGANLCYKCSTCADGYTLNSAGTACSSNNCSSGYTTGMTNLSHCTNASTHVAGTSYCHKCNTCAGEYYVSGSKCAACDWQGHGLSSCPGNCNCSSKSCGILTKYKVTSAKSNYYVSGNSCPACTWGGRSLTSCPSNCYCDSNTCGGTTKYRITSAVNGYVISGNSCVCDMSSYPLYSCPSGCNCGSKTCGSTTKYYVSSATTDHYVSGNSCPACDWSGYISSCPANGSCSSKTCGGVTKYAFNGCNSCFAKNSAGTACEPAMGLYCPYYHNGVAIGVVYDTTNRLVVSLEAQAIPFLTPTDTIREETKNKDNADAYFITDATNALDDYAFDDAVSNEDMNGLGNTNAIVAKGEATGRDYAAAKYCKNMTTGGKTWFLPAFGQMKSWLDKSVANAIESGMARAGASTMYTGSNRFYVGSCGYGCYLNYWSSTQYWKAKGTARGYYEYDKPHTTKFTLRARTVLLKAVGSSLKMTLGQSVMQMQVGVEKPDKSSSSQQFSYARCVFQY